MGCCRDVIAVALVCAGGRSTAVRAADSPLGAHTPPRSTKPSGTLTSRATVHVSWYCLLTPSTAVGCRVDGDDVRSGGVGVVGEFDRTEFDPGLGHRCCPATADGLWTDEAPPRPFGCEGVPREDERSTPEELRDGERGTLLVLGVSGSRASLCVDAVVALRVDAVRRLASSDLWICDIFVNMLTTVASVMRWLRARISRPVRVLLCSRTLARACAPSLPTLLLAITNDSSVWLRRSIRENATAPSSPMLLCPMLREVRLVFDWSASAMALAPSLPRLFSWTSRDLSSELPCSNRARSLAPPRPRPLYCTSSVRSVVFESKASHRMDTPSSPRLLSPNSRCVMHVLRRSTVASSRAPSALMLLRPRCTVVTTLFDTSFGPSRAMPVLPRAFPRRSSTGSCRRRCFDSARGIDGAAMLWVDSSGVVVDIRKTSRQIKEKKVGNKCASGKNVCCVCLAKVQ
eukprot:PhM_4_TR14849/c0_g1_i1/m.82926